MTRFWFFIISLLSSMALQAQTESLPVIDLQNRIPASPYRLVEEGRLYWQEFLDAGQTPVQAGIASVATVWNNKVLTDQTSIESFGFATYEFRVRLSPDATGYQIGLRTASTAFQLMAYPLLQPEEAVFARSGQVGKTAETTIPSQRFALVKLHPKSADEIWVIRIQVANFLHKRGGLWQKPFIGHGTSVERMYSSNEQKDMFSLGFMLLMTFYCLMLYVRRKEDMESLMLAATSAMAFFRTLTTGTLFYSALEVDSVNAFVTLFRLEYITLAGGPISYMLFVHYSFKQQSHQRIALGIAIISLMNILLALIAPIQIFSGFLPFYQVGFIANLIFFYIVLYRAWRAGHDGAGTALLGAIAVSFAGIYDIFVNMNIMPQPYIAQYGVGVFLLFQSQVIAGRFANAFRTAERLQKELRIEVERQTGEIRSLMENVPQGIFIVQSDLTIQGNYSLYLEQLLGFKDLGGRLGLEVLFAGCVQSSEQKSMAMSALVAAMEEESLVWSFNESCLPRELRRQHPNGEFHILEIDWHPIISTRDRIERVLVTVRNVTRVRELEAESRRHQAEFEMLTEIIQAGRSDVLRFLEQGRLYITRCQALIEEQNQSLDAIAGKVFLHIHTLKGLARALGLRTMTTQIHDLEQELGEHQKTRWESWSRIRAAEVVNLCRSVFVSYQSIMEEKLHWTGDGGGEIVSELDIKEMDRELRLLPTTEMMQPAMLPFVRKVEQIVSRLAYQEAYTLLGDLNREARSLALELGKPIPEVKFEGEGILLSRSAETLLRSALIHLIRNSLDHGLESIEERRMLGKNVAGCIQLTFEHRGDRMQMRYADDGRGLNLAAIRQRALSLGLIKIDDPMASEKILELVFTSGFSTKSQVDIISGRGVGMDAVRHLFTEAGGRIWIELAGHDLTAFTVFGELPASLYRVPSLAIAG